MIEKIPVEIRRKRWPRDVGSCIAGAAAVCIANATGGDWSPTSWEKKIEGKGFGEEIEATGKYSKNNPPSDSTAERVLAVYPDCGIDRWVHHPLWYLLASTGVDHFSVDYALDSLVGKIRLLIWMDEENDSSDNEGICTLSLDAWRGQLRLQTTMSSLKGISRYRNIKGLTALVALTLEARSTRQYRNMCIGAKLLWDMFPRVVATNPHLYIRWPTLAGILNEKIWLPPKNITISLPWFSMPIEALKLRVEQEISSKHLSDQLPPKRFIL